MDIRRVHVSCSSMAVVCLIAILDSAGHAAVALPRYSPPELVARINRSWQCTDYTIIGLCYCGPVPCGFQVVQYVPAVFAETTRTPGETMTATLDFSQAAAAAAELVIEGHTRQIHQSGMDNTFEAHVYAMPEHLVQLANACTSCKLSSAQLPAAVSGWPRGAGDGFCGSIDHVVAALGGLADAGGMNGYAPSLRYASEVDALQWRTGCRDLSLVNLLSANGWTCTAQGSAGFLGTPEPLARLLGEDACIGLWGPNFPRQMRTRGPDEVRAAAIAAYRAMSLARTDLQTLNYPVDTLGKMQQAYPAISQCVRVGASATLPSDMRRSPDGAYGWIYWRPAVCCVPFDIGSNC